MAETSSLETGRLVLALTVFALLILCGIWDAIAIYKQQPALTVSSLVRFWCSNWAMIPFLLGVLIGHLLG